MIAKQIQNWVDESVEKIEDETIETGNFKFKDKCKVVALGMVEGYLDTALIVAPILFGAAMTWKHKALKK